MNRLIIIGNGFDLAHRLPTSYKDFIDDYWRNVITKITTNFAYTDELFEAHAITLKYNHLAKHSWENVKSYYDIFYFLNNHNDTNFLFKNELFRIISNQISLQNWVDVENIYYEILKSVAINKNNKHNYLRDISTLNSEFEQVKNLLEKYLKEKVIEKYNFQNTNTSFHDIFYPDILDNSKIDKWKEDFSIEDKDYINQLIREGNHNQVKLRFLNFNYTPTLSIYFHMNRGLYTDSEFFIHGKLNDTNNKINFGFGDEMDEDYKLIEKIDDNEYLKNFKSFQYLQNNTYKKLMDFVESGRFEVFIMGSSCGLSDRTLLNTIFEHKNCRLIKVFYYQWEEKGEKKDNFTELTQNISRHFNDKKLMRSKIVHKNPEHVIPKIELLKKH